MVTKVKKKYTKPQLDTKGFAQFENVFTACNKGNAKIGCTAGTYDDPSSAPDLSAAFNAVMST